ncbi:hypothetical protein NPX13_g9000 [Xylaria arbuscula]|uniref:Uncharacterized protein n=1 Tax=Xylaria arbuscula TaxID=114810 RepID=A0A9W8N7P1_9PEZI|nr:hypothetical protein NPX13_g9000 [Xylaria arbuscula]
MAGTRCSFPPDRVTFEGYCEDWIRWVTELENIESQHTDQAELSASQDYRDIQSEMQQLQGRLQQLQDALQQRLRAHETATKENRQLFWARLKMHLRNILPTDMLHLEASRGGEDHDQHNQAPLCISRDGIQEPITPPVPRADVKRATLKSLAAAALLYHDDIAEAAEPAEFPHNFKQNCKVDMASSVETTVSSRESASTDLVEYMDFPSLSRPEHALNHNQASSSSQKQFKCLDPKCNRLGWARPEHLKRHLSMYYALPFFQES